MYFENVYCYSEETVSTSLFTTTYSLVILKMFLVVLRSQIILLTLLLRTAEGSWKCSYLFWGEGTYCSQFYYVKLRYF